MGSFDLTSSNSRIRVWCEWAETDINTSGNTSKISCTVYLQRQNSGYTTGGTMNTTVKIGSQTLAVNGLSFVNTGASATLLFNKTSGAIAHDSNGSKSITISVSCTATANGNVILTASGSKTVSLTTIARTSQVSMSSTNFTVGNDVYVYTNRTSTDFTHEIFIKRADGLYYDPVATGVTDRYNLNTQAVKEILYTNSTNSDTISSTILLRTKNGSVHIGDSPINFKATIPENEDTKPTVTMTLQPINTLAAPFSDLYIQGKTKVGATFTGVGKYGATLSSYRLTVDGKPFDLSDYLSASGEITVEGIGTDTREFTGSASETIMVYAYQKPLVIRFSNERDIICKRCDANGNIRDDGTFLKIKAGRKYYTIDVEGQQTNYCSLQYRYRSAGSDSFTQWVTLLDKNDLNRDEVDVVLNSISLSVSQSYVVEIGAFDDLEEYSVLSFNIPTASTNFHLKEGGSGAAFGKYAEHNDMLELAPDWDLKLKGAIVADFIVEQAVVGMWTYRKWNSGIAECWGTKSVNNTGWSAWAGEVNLAVGGGSGRINYPANLFVARPIETVTSHTSYNNHFLTSDSDNHGTNTKNATDAYNIAKAGQGDVNEITYDFYVIGRWK